MIGGLSVLLALSVAPAQASQEGRAPLAVGVYLPSVFFVGSAEKAGFLTALESALSQATGQPVVASFQLEAKNLANSHLWVVDAAAAAARDDLSVVSRAQSDRGAQGRVSVYTRRDWPSVFELLSRGNVVVPSGQDGDLLRYWLLLDEPNAAAIAKRARGVRDARAALMAVAAGEADGALVLDARYKDLEPRFAAIKEVTWLRELPLPVLAINRRIVGAEDAARWQSKLRAAQLPAVAGVISTWKPSGAATDLTELGQAVRSRKSPVNRSLVLASLPLFPVLLGELMPAPPKASPLAPALAMPPRRLLPLPDPPATAVERPAVSRWDAGSETRSAVASATSRP